SSSTMSSRRSSSGCTVSVSVVFILRLLQGHGPQWQLERDDRPTHGAIAHGDAAAESAGDVDDQEQAQAAAGQALGRLIGLAQPRQYFGGKAPTPVGHRDDQ